MESYLKIILTGIIVIILLIISTVVIILVGSIIFVPSSYGSTKSPSNSITFEKVSASSVQVKDGQYFNLTSNDFGNVTSLKFALDTFLNSPAPQSTYGTSDSQTFNEVTSILLSKSHGFTIFLYENTFIQFTINY